MRSRHILVAAVLTAGCTSSTEPSSEVWLEAVTTTDLTGIVGSEVLPAPIVRAIGPGGTPVKGLPILFQVDSGGGDVANARINTDSLGLAAVGRWTLGTAARTQSLTASSDRGPSQTFAARAGAGPAEEITRVAGDGQIARVREALLRPLMVRVSDAFGNPVANAVVAFAVLSGGGQVDGEWTTTGDDGIASSGRWTLGSAPGVQEVKAESGGAEITFSASGCLECATLLFVDGTDIYWTIVNGEQRISLTDGFQPAWSPDGQRIAFVRYVVDEARDDIFLMDADGSNIVRRTFSGGGGTNRPGFHSPTWSPDGTRLAVATGGTYEGSIYVLEAADDGGDPVALADMAAAPAWSPDGSEIAFVSLSGDDGYNALHATNADGSGAREVTPRDGGGIDRPTWSPGGETIAFSKCIHGSCDLYSVGADGSDLLQITHGLIALGPAWSPDGSWIAFTLWSSWTDPTRVPSIALLQTGEAAPTITVVGTGAYPSWRP